MYICIYTYFSYTHVCSQHLLIAASPSHPILAMDPVCVLLRRQEIRNRAKQAHERKNRPGTAWSPHGVSKCPHGAKIFYQTGKSSCFVAIHEVISMPTRVENTGQIELDMECIQWNQWTASGIRLMILIQAAVFQTNLAGGFDFFYFPYIGNFIVPNDFLIFQRDWKGVETSNHKVICSDSCHATDGQ